MEKIHIDFLDAAGMMGVNKIVRVGRKGQRSESTHRRSTSPLGDPLLTAALVRK